MKLFELLEAIANPHGVLGVARSATAAEIKTAYRKLAMKHHPDRGGEKAEFQKIQAAYSQLSKSTDTPAASWGASDAPRSSAKKIYVDDDNIIDKLGKDLDKALKKFHSYCSGLKEYTLWFNFADKNPAPSDDNTDLYYFVTGDDGDELEEILNKYGFTYKSTDWKDLIKTPGRKANPTDFHVYVKPL